MDHAARVLTSQFLAICTASLVTTTLYELGNDRRLKSNAVKQLQGTASSHFLVTALLSHEVVQSLHIQKTAVKLRELMELDEVGSSVRSPATSAEVGLLVKDSLPLV